MSKLSTIGWIFILVLMQAGPAGCRQDKLAVPGTETVSRETAPAVTGTRPEAAREDILSMAGSLNAFALDLHGRMRSRPGNLSYSPFAIFSALMLAQAGAGGETEAKMARALHFSMPRERAHAACAQLGAGIPFRLAASIWVQKSFRVLPGFGKMLSGLYGTAPRTMDVDRRQAAADAINAWASEKAGNVIRGLVSPETITVGLRLVLASASHFNGLWKTSFPVAATRIGPFWVDRANGVPAQIMSMEGDFFYAETPEMQMLMLPYRDSRLDMVILLPRQIPGLPLLEDKLGEVMTETIARLRKRRVEVRLPRFDLQWAEDIDDVLKGLGLESAFDPRQADFSRISGDRDLFIGRVIHQAMISVQEEGCEAAAAAFMEKTTVATPPLEPAVFRADHPFLFVIRDSSSGALLFVGRVADPGRPER